MKKSICDKIIKNSNIQNSIKKDFKSSFKTKIISGIYKGKTINIPSNTITRSSKNRLKESFFNTLQFDTIDKIFIEAFGGSGGIGLEALSRGVKRVYFIEKDINTYKILKNNCKLLDSSKCINTLGDTFDILPKVLNELKNSKDEIILYIDPPFNIRDNCEDIYKKCFNIVENISNSNIFLICFEHSSNTNMPLVLNNFNLTKSKKFGKSSLSYYKSI